MRSVFLHNWSRVGLIRLLCRMSMGSFSGVVFVDEDRLLCCVFKLKTGEGEELEHILFYINNNWIIKGMYG